MEKSYIELLAENDAEARKEFEPNPKELFVDHGEYDDIDAHQEKEHDELENQEAFQKYGGSHQQASKLAELPPTRANHTTAVEYDKAVTVHVISIDSRFRSSTLDSPSQFYLKLLAPIKNVVSVRLSSLEIPNTWYTFSNIRGNTSFDVHIASPTLLTSTGDPATAIIGRIVIPEGNYTLDPNAITNNIFQNVLVTQLNTAFTSYNFTVTLDPINSLLTVACTDKLVPPNNIKFQIFNHLKLILLTFNEF
jgi:hypothetical protein